MTFYRIENESVMNTEKNDPYLTTKIVRSYVRHHTVSPEQISDLITSVHQALGRLGRLPETEEVRTPAVSVRRSVHRDYVICLDCGYRGKTLRRHIAARHGLGRDEYLQRWGLRSDHPLIAPAYSERRSSQAKALGLGRRSTVEITLSPPAATPVVVDQGSEATLTRRRRSRSVSKSANVANEAAAAPTPAKKTRPRSRVKSKPQQISSPTVPS